MESESENISHRKLNKPEIPKPDIYLVLVFLCDEKHIIQVFSTKKKISEISKIEYITS